MLLFSILMSYALALKIKSTQISSSDKISSFFIININYAPFFDLSGISAQESSFIINLGSISGFSSRNRQNPFLFDFMGVHPSKRQKNLANGRYLGYFRPFYPDFGHFRAKSSKKWVFRVFRYFGQISCFSLDLASFQAFQADIGPTYRSGRKSSFRLV